MTTLILEIITLNIRDDDIIKIKDHSGYITSGYWYNDNILEYIGSQGTVERKPNKVEFTIAD